MTLTKSLSYVEGCYKGVENGLKAHGHKPTELMYTDNAHAEVAFHERTTASLQRNVSHIIIDPYVHLPVLKLPRAYDLQYYDASDLINSACYQLLSRVGKDDSKLVVGFSIKYQVEPNGQGGLVPKSQAVDVI